MGEALCCQLIITIFLLSSLPFLIKMNRELSKLQVCCSHLLENKYIAFRDYYMSAKKMFFFPDITKAIYQNKIIFFSWNCGT